MGDWYRTGYSEDLLPEEDLDCPECGGKLRRRYSSKYQRLFYSCENFFKTKCSGSIGCHKNGKALGIPTTKEGKKSRIAAHEVFDSIWKEGYLTWSEAYAWLAKEMGEEEVHIGHLSPEECQQVLDLATNYLSEVNG